MTSDSSVGVADAYQAYVSRRRSAEAQAAKTAARSGTCWAERWDLEGVLFMLFFGWWIFLLYGVGRLLGLVGSQPEQSPVRSTMQHYRWNAHTQRYDIPVNPVSPPPPCYCAYRREYCPIHRGY